MISVKYRLPDPNAQVQTYMGEFPEMVPNLTYLIHGEKYVIGRIECNGMELKELLKAFEFTANSEAPFQMDQNQPMCIIDFPFSSIILDLACTAWAIQKYL